MKTICMVGAGYIGLPTAAVLAEAGAKVIAVDVDPRVVEAINAGRSSIVEPGLEDAVRTAVEGGRLRARQEMPAGCDAYIIAVPTPVKDDRSADLTYVRAAFEAVAPALRPGATLILESTSPVGTTEQMLSVLRERRPDLRMPDAIGGGDIAVAYCPERILPGNALHELIANDRIIGGISPDCANKARDVYALFVKGHLYLSSARTAEMAKLVENASRDVSIAFANELSLVCDAAGIDVWELIALANRHPRVNILQPGPGVGGHCIAVDPWFIIDQFPQQSPLMRTARAVNDGKPAYVVSRVAEAVSKLDLGREPVVGCLGLAFKPNIDDLRSSPALDIVRKLGATLRARVLAVEPHVEDTRKCGPGITLATLEECLEQADILVVLVAHDAFKGIGEADLAGRPHLDFVNLFAPRLKER